MKLVTFEEPIWATIQGEGVLVGTPSVFVRMHGCDFSCSWCDTKRSWQPGSRNQELSVSAILEQVRSFRLRHVVITGGNPLLQPDELAELVLGLQTEWVDRRRGDNWRPGMHVTVETQGSVYDEAIARSVDLLSLSPKLHNWLEDPLCRLIQTSLERGREVQVKVVCSSEAETREALQRIEDLYGWAMGFLARADHLHFILQPESSLGRKGVEVVRFSLERWMADSLAGYLYPPVRLIPQMHKTSLFVR